MTRDNLIKTVSVIFCLVIVLAGCGAGEQEQSFKNSSGQSKEIREARDDTVLFKLTDPSCENITDFLNGREDVGQISWSPDGRTAAFTVGDSQWDAQMYLWQEGESEAAKIEDARGRICEFLWSPDNRYVLADVGTSVQREGILVNSEYQVKNGEIPYVDRALWSPDSKWLAAGQVSEIRPVVEIELSGTVDLCIYPVQTGDRVILARGTEEAYYMPEKWEEDGTLRYVKTEFRNPSSQETGQFQLDMESGLVFYPSGGEFIESIADKRGRVEINADMRKAFNLFAKDYRWLYLPDMEYYESFFEADSYAEALGYNNFGYAVFYVLQYLRCPESLEAETMENAIRSLFAAREGYDKMPHQNFRKLAVLENGSYSPWPEGGIDHNRMFYLLTGLELEEQGKEELLVTVRCKNYYFNPPDFMQGENEKLLAQKAKEMGVSDLEAAAVLLENGAMNEFEPQGVCETTFLVQLEGSNPENYRPRFVRNHSYEDDSLEN